MKMTSETTPKTISKTKQRRKLLNKVGFESEAFNPNDNNCKTIDKIQQIIPDQKNDKTNHTNGEDMANMAINNDLKTTNFLIDFSDLLKCHLCKGYLIDAISLSECTHNCKFISYFVYIFYIFIYLYSYLPL